eukprot:jgi/Tetstr1/453095/TSEL_003935.t1
MGTPPPEPASMIKAHKLVEVSLESEEGKRVLELLEGSGYRAVGLQRNQNAALKASYEECLASMQRGPASLATDHETGQAIKRLRRSHGLPASQPPFQLNEALLFHKSRAAYSTILETGLSSCYVREQGCVFGKGIYFADDLRKSAQYGGPSQQVLVCRVALGDCAAVSPHGRRSTPGGNVVASWDQISAPRKHDCVKRYAGDTFFNSWFGQSDFNEFIVAKDVQVFPLYLLHYASEHGHEHEPRHGGRRHRGAGKQHLPVPSFVAGFRRGTVDPAQWGRMLGGLMGEIQLMDECVALNKALWTETVDLTGAEPPPSPPRGRALLSQAGTSTAEEIIILDDAEDVCTAAAAKRQKRPSGAAPSSAPLIVDLTQASQEEHEVIVICDSPPSGSAGALAAPAPERQDSDPETGGLPLTHCQVSASFATTANSCSICMEDWQEGARMVSLPCCSNAHFHDSADCFQPLLRRCTTMSGRLVQGVKCPYCKQQYGDSVGSCPDGTLDVATDPQWITLSFRFRGGFSPDGRPFSGRRQTAYLPNTPEARHLLPRIQRAHDLRHCFRLGVSDTTGVYGICWGSVHFKTSRSGGPQFHGFPDATYLERLTDELKLVLGSQ